MANRFTVELKYLTACVFDVEAEDEGEALTKARELAEMAPMSSFSIVQEEESRILNIAPLGDQRRE